MQSCCREAFGGTNRPNIEVGKEVSDNNEDEGGEAEGVRAIKDVAPKLQRQP